MSNNLSARIVRVSCLNGNEAYEVDGKKLVVFLPMQFKIDDRRVSFSRKYRVFDIEPE